MVNQKKKKFVLVKNIGEKKKVKKLGFINTKNYRSHRADVKYVLEDRYKGGYIRD